MPKVKTVVMPVSLGCDRYPGEALDCAVRALANATEKTYAECHDIFKQNGRESGKATKHNIVHQTYISNGMRLVCSFGTTNDARYVTAVYGVPNLKGTTLAKILKSLQDGKFIVSVRSHVFAVIDGDVIDNQVLSGAQSVTALYEVIE
jgi:hypothetical protein